MILSKATKVLTGAFQTSRHLQKNSQIKPLLLGRSRFSKKIDITKDPCAEKPKKSNKLVKIAGIAAVGTTVAVIAAKYDNDFRDWSKDHVPALDNLVTIIYQEEETYLEFLARGHKELTAWLKNALYDVFKGVPEIGRGEKGGKVEKEECEKSKTPYEPPASIFSESKDGMKDKKEEIQQGSKSSQAAVPGYLKELKDLEEKMGHAAQDSIQAYHAAVCALKDQAAFLANIEKVISKQDPNEWAVYRRKKEDEQKNIAKAKAGLQNLESTVNKLKARLEEGTELNEDIKVRARNNLTIVTGDTNKAKENFEKDKREMALAKRHWDKVRQARMNFGEELEIMFPNVWLNDEKLNLPVDSLDPFIENVLNSIQFLEKEKAKLENVSDVQVSSAIDKFKITGNFDDLATITVTMEGDKEKRLRREEMQKTLLTHQAKCDKSARAMMKQQAEVYSDLKTEAISMKEREVERKMQQQLEEQLAQTRAQHQLEIAKMVGRIQGANEAISQRGDIDQDQKKRQQFWSAAQSLLSAVKPIGPITEQKDLKSLKNEIINVMKAAPEGDKLVEVVVGSIPQQAAEQGVESEARLKDRFMTVEKEARRVAAVPCGKVSLLQLVMARLQSALYINQQIPQGELNNEPIDVDQLNNYEILHRARHYVDHAEFDQAVRYLNLLKGPSNKVASDWIRDVIVLLETQQVAELLMAHASAARQQT